MASVVNQWPVSAESTYGLQATAVSPTPGNALVAVIGWNSLDTGVNPVAGVADDANDWWIPLGISSKSGAVRCAAWIAPNIRPGPGGSGGASVVSLALSWFALGMCGLIVEMSGLPDFAVLDRSPATAFNNLSSTFTLSETALHADFAFAVLVSGNNARTVTPPGAPWNALTEVSINDPAGAGGAGDTKITPVWYAPSAGSVSASWSLTGSAPLAGVLALILQSPAAPIQPNPNWPALKAEAAFGYTPGDPTVMPAWTDVSGRVIGPEGEAIIKTARGRAYELTQPEPGTLGLAFDNHDGAFTPGNASSPYYPDVKVSTQARVTAVWGNVTYAVGSGFMERWPQEWPDLPQWGRSRSLAADSVGALGSTRIVSAYGGEALIDSPWVYVPCGEFYPAGSTGNDGAQGLPLANLSRSNQRPAICQNGVARSGSYPTGTGYTYVYLETGLALGMAGDTASVNYLTTGGRRVLLIPTKSSILAGDSGTGIGVSQNATHGLAHMPGAIYVDPNLPQPSASGITVDFWAVIPTTANNSDTTELLRVSGQAGNYVSANTDRGGRLGIFWTPGVPSPGVNVTVGDYLDNTDTLITFGTVPGDGELHYYAVTVTVSSGNYVVTLYVDGALVDSLTSTGVTVLSDWQQIGIGPVMYANGGSATGFNYTIAHAAYYGSALPAARIAAHYQAGSAAWSGDTAPQRVARLMTWGGYGFARAGDLGSPSPLLGPADQVQGQSVAQAAYDVASTDGGMFYADAAGNATYRSRAALYNRPVKWVFGDGVGGYYPATYPATYSGDEIHYDPTASFGYDNSFITNYAISQRSSSSTNFGGSYTAADTTSQQQYLVRGPLQQNVETTSEQDPQDRANWTLAKYKQPSLRVQQVVIEPSSYPGAWPAALGVEQGDVVTVNRRPLGGAAISETGIVQKVSHDVTPISWRTTIIAVPYTPENAVLLSGDGSTVGSSALPW